METPNKEAMWLDHARADEEMVNIRKVKEWLLPLLKSNLVNKSLKDLTLLSVGCGYGADVDTLVDSGINAYGIEPFPRNKAWRFRKHQDRLIEGDGRRLPFGDGTFDVIYCMQVLEHVGYEDNQRFDITKLKEERKKFVSELNRVLATGGIIILATPNRHFGVDMGHGANLWGLRFHSPFSDFLASFKEIRSFFLQKGGGSHIVTLPYQGYIIWDSYNKNYPVIRRLRPVIKTYLAILDRLPFLRSSFLSPVLLLALKKNNTKKYWGKRIKNNDKVANALKMLTEEDFATSATASMAKAYLTALKLIDDNKIDRILDLGCGFGGVTRLTAAFLSATEAYGVDNNPNILKVAQDRGLRTTKADIEVDQLPFPPDYFDLVISNGVIEHLRFFDNLLTESYRVLKRGGYLLITWPNLANYIQRISLLLGYQPSDVVISKEIYVGTMFLSGKPAINHIHTATIGAMKQLLEYYNFTLVGMRKADPKVTGTYAKWALLFKLIGYLCPAGLSRRIIIVARK